MTTMQGTDEWKLAKCGWVGASRVADIIAKTKTGPSASRAKYMGQLIAERLTGKPMETYQSAAMERGIELEAEARSLYELKTKSDVVETSFLRHPRIVYAGCSPDGLVGDDGLIEIKSPLTHNHVETLLGQSIDGRYITQMQWQMATTGRAWCDYCSYDPTVPAKMQLFVKRVTRDTDTIAELESAVRQFLSELDAKLEVLCERYGLKVVTREAA